MLPSTFCAVVAGKDLLLAGFPQPDLPFLHLSSKGRLGLSGRIFDPAVEPFRTLFFGPDVALSGGSTDLLEDERIKALYLGGEV